MRGNQYGLQTLISIRKNRILFLCFLGMLFFGCSEPFEFETPINNVLVIDAKVSNIPGRSFADIYQVKDGLRSNVSNLNVSIVSEEGEVTEFSFNDRIGQYLPVDPLFSGTVGTSYRFEGYDEAQLRFVSSYESVQSPFQYELAVSDSVILDVSAAGILVERDALAANVIVIAEEEGYSKFDFSYSYRHNYTGATLTVSKDNDFMLFASDKLEAGEEVNIPVGYEVRETWYFLNPDPSCDQVPSFPCNEPCCLESERWVVEYHVKQERLTQVAYDYWQQVERLKSNDGLLFDTFPFPLSGNVHCEGCEDEFMGFFRAVSEETRSQLVNL